MVGAAVLCGIGMASFLLPIEVLPGSKRLCRSASFHVFNCRLELLRNQRNTKTTETFEGYGMCSTVRIIRMRSDAMLN